MGTLNNAIVVQTQKVQEVIDKVNTLLALTGKDEITMEQIAELIRKATQEAIDEVLQQLEGLDVVSLKYRVDHVDRILGDILLTLKANDMDTKSDGTLVENFNPPSKIDQTRINVTSIVPGSSEIDVASEPKIGKEYILSDGISENETVIVESIARGGNIIRVKLKAPPIGSYRSGAGYLMRTTAVIYGGNAYVGGNEKTSVITPDLTFNGETVPGGAQSAEVALNSTTRGSFDITGSPYFSSVSVKLAQFIGLCMDNPSLGVNGWKYVDNSGNFVTISDKAAFFNEFLLTTAFEETIDGQVMVRFPKGFARAWTGEAGSDAVGKFCVGVSPQELENLKIYPAFYNYDATADGSGNVPEISLFHLGKYKASLNAGKIESLTGKAPRVSVTIGNLGNECRARNVGGVTGFTQDNIWMQSWVDLLMLIRAGNGDLQTAFGRGHVDGYAAVNTGVSNANCLNINSPWGNVWAYLEGLTTGAGGILEIWAPGKAKQLVSLGFKNGTGNQIKTIKQGVNANIGGRDLGLLMLAETVSATTPIIDDHNYNGGTAGHNCYHGGYWLDAGGAGPFCRILSNSASNTNAANGGRLAKYPAL